MSNPSCPKCESTRFEMVEFDVKGAIQQHLAIICSSCGTIVGTEEALSSVRILCKIADRLNVDIDQ